jgi:hypothetical protein
MMIGENALCEGHIKTYNLSDWMGKGDWEAMQDAARERGYKLADRGAITVQFQPIGWKPGNKFLEIERNNG